MALAGVAVDVRVQSGSVGAFEKKLRRSRFLPRRRAAGSDSHQLSVDAAETFARLLAVVEPDPETNELCRRAGVSVCVRRGLLACLQL